MFAFVFQAHVHRADGNHSVKCDGTRAGATGGSAVRRADGHHSVKCDGTRAGATGGSAVRLDVYIQPGSSGALLQHSVQSR